MFFFFFVNDSRHAQWKFKLNAKCVSMLTVAYTCISIAVNFLLSAEHAQYRHTCLHGELCSALFEIHVVGIV